MTLKAYNTEDFYTVILDDILNQFSPEDQVLIRRSYAIVQKYTDGTWRKNGDPGISHPLIVAQRVVEAGLGSHSVSAALLHDLIEDNPEATDLQTCIRDTCGEDVEHLVLEMTVIEHNPAEKVPFHNAEIAQKQFLSQISDLRTVIIKLADILHNLETIEGLSPQRQESFIAEVENLYLPASEYLGVKSLHRKIETIVFAYQHPREYKAIATYIATHHVNGEEMVKKITSELSNIVALSHRSASVEGRFKSIPSIYKKMEKYVQEGKPDDIRNLLDILAFRIIVDTEKDCYSILSAILSRYHIQDDRIKDYIAKPKLNGYKSIHLIAYDENDTPFEIQIRTHEMHTYNEYGQASHVLYKRQGSREATPSTEFTWTSTVGRVMKEYQRNDDKPIPVHFFNESIFVLTPKNEFFQLPKGATAIDLAYTIHTDLGNQCVGVKIDGKVRPLETTLQSGNIVEILKNSNKKHPDRSWLEVVQTSLAKAKIRQRLR
jgi:GTP diphosphokinase / guanosine-3',5'-bis(diphosphate) 3'-diphosphatase